MKNIIKPLFKINKRQGFSLIELIVVIAIIGILVLLAMPWFTKHLEGAEEATTKHNIRVVENAVEEYLTIHEDLPEELTPFPESEISDAISEERVNDIGGPVTDVEDGPYVDITDSIFTKDIKNKKGKIVANNLGKVYIISKDSTNNNESPNEPVIDETGRRQPYTDEEIEAMLSDGWIPIAHPMDFFWFSLSEDIKGYEIPFAVGTEWEREVIVQDNPKFLQVADLDLRSKQLTDFYCDFDPEECGREYYQWDFHESLLIDGFTYNGGYNKIFTGGNTTYEATAYILGPSDSKFEKIVFDGYENMLNTNNGRTPYSVWTQEASNCTFEDIWIENAHLNKVGAFLEIGGSGNTYNNVHFEGSVISGSTSGALAGSAAKISNSTVHADIEAGGEGFVANYVGGFVGTVGLVENSNFVGSITTDSGHVGGIAGTGKLAVNTHVNANIEALYDSYDYDDYYVGGLFGIGGYNSNIFPEYPEGAIAINSSTSGEIKSNSMSIGGLIGATSDWWLEPSYSNIFGGSTSTMIQNPELVNSWMYSLVGLKPPNGTHHDLECPLWDEYPSGFQHNVDAECECPYYFVVDPDENRQLIQ